MSPYVTSPGVLSELGLVSPLIDPWDSNGVRPVINILSSKSICENIILCQ